MSYFLGPLICRGFLGFRNVQFFPPFPADGEFDFEKAVQTVSVILHQLKLLPDDILAHPKGDGSLYFSMKLQEAVLLKMEDTFLHVWQSMHSWIWKRFVREKQQHDLKMAPLFNGAPATSSAASTRPDATDRMLLQACAELDLDPQRVLNVIQPISRDEALQPFLKKGMEMASAGLERGEYVNPAGHRWVLLSIPGTSQDEQYREASRLFGTPDLQSMSHTTEVDLATEFDLASAEYCGVGVLARALFGNRLSLYDDGFESSGQNQTQGDCWTGSCPHQPQMRSLFFRALIKSYQCTQSSYLTSMTIWMASETTFRPPQNLETTSVHQRKLAQILMGNVLNVLDVQGCKSSSITLGGQKKIRRRLFVELGKGRMQWWRDASK